MGALGTLIILLFCYCFQKLNDKKAIKCRILILSLGIVPFVIFFIILFLIDQQKISAIDFLLFIFVYFLLYSWRVFKDLILYFGKENSSGEKSSFKNRIRLIKEKISEKLHKNNNKISNSFDTLKKDKHSLEYLLTVSGKIFFVSYYEQLKNWHKADVYDIIRENCSEQTKVNKITAAKAIFERNENIDALRIIISNPETIDDKTFEKAEDILSKELVLNSPELKSEKIQSRVSESFENGNKRFLVRIGLKKFIVDVSKGGIKFVMDLC